MFIQILAITLVLVLMFFMIRGVTRIYIDSVLKKRQRKKFAKNQTFKEWFLYTRYLDIIPKYLRIWYYSNFLMYVLSLIAVVVLNACGMGDLGRSVIGLYFFINAAALVSSKFYIN